MTIETVAINSLSADPANPRKHGQRNLDAIAASLRRFGQQKPIVVDSRGVVRAGNGQLAAAKLLGWTEIRIVRSDLPPTELTAFAIADNRTAELAEWDAEVLEKLLSDADLGDVGFTDEEMEKFAGKTGMGEGAETEIHESFEVVVECRDEEQQKQLYERLRSEGYSCRLFTL
jgi:site-specific DNA-methyltransferase (adenine-specific)